MTEVKEKVEDTEKKIAENRKKINNLTKEKLQLEWDLKERGNALELNTLKQNNQELLLSKATKENKSLNIEVVLLLICQTIFTTLENII